MQMTSLKYVLINLLDEFHREESGVAATEYIIVFSLISLICTIAILNATFYVKGYRDLMIYWLAHPAV